MTQARKRLIDLSSTPYYHCIARCVRRAFLCGECHLTGNSYEHRKQWVADRLTTLSRIFAIDIAAYAVMSNHYHLVLRVDEDKALNWSDTNVIRRWGSLFSIPPIIRMSQQKDASPAVIHKAQELIQTWRSRLMSISWFMRCLNEHLARKANIEDQCTGRFWEGRFKSQALLDEAAVLTAMTYVDLNPIRAKIAKTPESSSYTSIRQRILELLNKPKEHSIKLMTLSSSTQQSHKNAIQFSNNDYLNLVDWSGRIIRQGKQGYVSAGAPPILERLNLNTKGFVSVLKRDDDIAGLNALGSPTALNHFIEKQKRSFVKGIRLSKTLFQY
ncbi:MAG: transposase [Gammaproteobacteria bacterium]|nr:transposase [Gammaproteobacteria bacterium]